MLDLVNACYIYIMYLSIKQNLTKVMNYQNLQRVFLIFFFFILSSFENEKRFVTKAARKVELGIERIIYHYSTKV